MAEMFTWLKAQDITLGQFMRVMEKLSANPFVRLD